MPPRPAPIEIEPQTSQRYTLFTRPNRFGGTIRCRSETVMVFQTVVPNAIATVATALTHSRGQYPSANMHNVQTTTVP